MSPLSVPGLYSGARVVRPAAQLARELRSFPQTDAAGVWDPPKEPREKIGLPNHLDVFRGVRLPAGACFPARSRALQVSATTFAGCAKLES